MCPARLQSALRGHELTANLLLGEPSVAYLYAIRDILIFEKISNHTPVRPTAPIFPWNMDAGTPAMLH